MRSILFFGIYMERIDVKSWAAYKHVENPCGLCFCAGRARPWLIRASDFGKGICQSKRTACRSAALFPFAGRRNPKKGLDKIGFPV